MSTLRERIEEILIEQGIDSEKIGTVTGRLVALGRGKDVTIVHQVGPNGYHRLIVNGEPTEWTPPTEIIRSGDFIASTDAFINQLPQVGKVFALKAGKDFKTESVQQL